MTTQSYNADKLELLIDGHHGIYIPKLFSEYFPEYVTDEQREILSNTDNELYWDIWEEVLNSTITNDKGEEYILMQDDGDLWAMPANMEYPEF